MTDSTINTQQPQKTTQPTTGIAPSGYDYDAYDDYDAYNEDGITDEMLEDLELRAAWGELPAGTKVLAQYSKQEGQDGLVRVNSISQTEGRSNAQAAAEVAATTTAITTDLDRSPSPEPITLANVMPTSISGVKQRLAPCFRCGEPGHTQKECPHSSGSPALRKSDGASDIICYRCGLNGHLVRDCRTDLRTVRVGARCIYCGKYGHKRFACPDLLEGSLYQPEEKRPRVEATQPKEEVRPTDKEVITIESDNDSNNVDAEKIVVVSDDEEDNIATARKEGEQNLQPKGNKQMYCYNCGQPGHTGESCKKPNIGSLGWELPPPNSKRNHDWFKKVEYEERIFGPRISVSEEYGVGALSAPDIGDSFRGGNSRPSSPQPLRRSGSHSTQNPPRTPSRSPPPYSGNTNNNKKGDRLKRSTSNDRQANKFGTGFKRRK